MDKLEYILLLVSVIAFYIYKGKIITAIKLYVNLFYLIYEVEANQLPLLDIISCPTLTFECIDASDGHETTFWNGTAFKCGNSHHEIKFLHYQFNESSRSMGSCSNGTLVGWIDRVENGSYISHLNVSLSIEIIGSNIKCFGDDNEGEVIMIGQSLLGGICCNSYYYSLILLQAIYIMLFITCS